MWPRKETIGVRPEERKEEDHQWPSKAIPSLIQWLSLLLVFLVLLSFSSSSLSLSFFVCLGSSSKSLKVKEGERQRMNYIRCLPTTICVYVNVVQRWRAMVMVIIWQPTTKCIPQLDGTSYVCPRLEEKRRLSLFLSPSSRSVMSQFIPWVRSLVVYTLAMLYLYLDVRVLALSEKGWAKSTSNGKR